jgi:hypothetical protein
VSGLLTVTARKFIWAGIGAVANTMTKFITVETLDHCAISVLLLLLRAGLEDMSKFVAIAALRDATVDRNPCICQTLDVFLR